MYHVKNKYAERSYAFICDPSNASDKVHVQVHMTKQNVHLTYQVVERCVFIVTGRPYRPVVDSSFSHELSR